MKFTEIPQMTKSKYRVNVSWDFLKEHLRRYKKSFNFDLNPDFQRDFIWTHQQKIDYIEYILKGGISGRDIFLNHPNWMGSFEGNLVIVDGKQRIQAVLDFLDDKIPAFSHLYSEFEDGLPFSGPDFIFNVNDLKDKKEILQWYIDLNTGGTSHTNEEIHKVQKMIKDEK